MGQKLFTTAAAIIKTNNDGNKSIASICDEQTRSAENINQAMIARHTTAALKTTGEKSIVDIVGKNGNGEWIRMDEI